MQNFSRSIQVILVMIIAICATGCANRRGFGTFVPDNRAKTDFETFVVNPGYRSYISGSDVYHA